MHLSIPFEKWPIIVACPSEKEIQQDEVNLSPESASADEHELSPESSSADEHELLQKTCDKDHRLPTIHQLGEAIGIDCESSIFHNMPSFPMKLLNFGNRIFRTFSDWIGRSNVPFRSVCSLNDNKDLRH